MELTKDFSVNFISLLYKSEMTTNYIVTDSQKEIKGVENLEQRVEKLLEKTPNNPKTLNIKREIEQLKKDLFAIEEEVREVKSGKDTLFDWVFIDDNNKDQILDLILNQKIEKWILEKISNDQKIICAQIDLDKIITINGMSSISQINKVSELFKVKEKRIIFVLLSSPFNLKGKENAYIYFRSLTKDIEQIGKCNVTDMISTKLLSVEEEIDLEILNNLKENNDLSKLYALTYKESLNKNFSMVKEDLLSNLERKVNNLTRKSKDSE